MEKLMVSIETVNWTPKLEGGRFKFLLSFSDFNVRLALPEQGGDNNDAGNVDEDLETSKAKSINQEKMLDLFKKIMNYSIVRFLLPSLHVSVTTLTLDVVVNDETVAVCIAPKLNIFAAYSSVLSEGDADLSALSYIFGEGYSRLFSFHIAANMCTVRAKDLVKVVDTPSMGLSMMFAKTASGVNQIGFLALFDKTDLKMSTELINALKKKRDADSGVDIVYSLTEAITSKILSLLAKSRFLVNLIGSSALLCKSISLHAPLQDFSTAEHESIAVDLNVISVVLKASMDDEQVHLSFNLKLEDASAQFLPSAYRICTLKSLTFWTDLTLFTAEPVFPFYLPVGVHVDSFLTMNDPVLNLTDSLLLQVAQWNQTLKKTKKGGSAVNSFENALLELFKFKLRIHLINFDANLTVIPIEQEERDFMLSAEGRQLCISASSISEHVNALNHEIPKGMINVVVEHSNASLIASSVQSKLFANSPTARANRSSRILVLPASSITTILTPDFQIDCNLFIDSIALDFSSIARDTQLYDSVLTKVIHNLGLLKAATGRISEPVEVQAPHVLPQASFSINAKIELITVAFSAMVHPFHSLIVIGKKGKLKLVKINQDLESHLEVGELLFQSAPVDYAIRSCLDIRMLRVSRKSLKDPIHCVANESDMYIDISKIYVLIKCLSFLVHLDNLAKRILGSSSPPLTAPLTPVEKEMIPFSLILPVVTMHVELPESNRGVGVFSNLSLQSEHSSKISGSFDSFLAHIYKDSDVKLSELVILREVSMEFKLPENNDPLVFTLDSVFSKLIVPNDWHFSNLVENGVNLIRVVKVLILECLEKEATNYFQDGRTFFVPAETPKFIVKSKETIILLEDNHFESLLGRNYRIGYEENLARLGREKEFMKKSKSKFPYMTQKEYIGLKRNLFMMNAMPGKTEKQISRAWSLLQEHNSSSYINLIAAVKSDPLPPLMLSKFYGLEVIASMPLCPLSLEETLHEMDENTPANLIYEDLIARQIKMTLNGMDFRLRDYTNPLIQLPTEGGTKFVMEGLVIIADPAGPIESLRKVEVPLENGDETILTTTRSVNPTKVYMQTETDIFTKSDFRISLGAPYEACMADVITVVDNFTKPSEDPSPPVGWWDKLRIIMHGTNTLKLRGGGTLSLLALGSASPYFDPRKHVGIEGMEWSITNGVDIVMGSATENPSSVSMSVECGELKVAIIHSEKHSSEQNREICFAKLTGGVRLILKSDFVTPSPDDKNIFIPPFRKHHEINMLTKDTFIPSSIPGIGNDSYFGFRSQFINVSMDIQSPRNYYSSLAVPRNCFFFNSGSIDGIQKVFEVYQSLLTNVPVRRGNLFNSNDVLNKPKLGRAIQSVALKTSFTPLMLSYILECEDGFEAVGLRLRATQMTFEAMFRQYNVKLISESILDRKPVTKWIRETNSTSFTNIEGKVLSYCGADSDLHIPHNHHDIYSEIGSWIFKEDSFEDLSSVSLLSCIWAPRLDIIALEASKQTTETEEAAAKAIMAVQYSLYQKRLNEVEIEISKYRERKSDSKSRGAVFFDDTDAQDYNAELESLHEKMQILLQSMEYCKIVMNGEGDTHARASHHKVFNTKYIVHNLKLLWNAPVRNIIFRMAEVETKNRFLSFCLSNAAAQVAAELVETMTKQQEKSKNRKKSMFDTKTKRTKTSAPDDILESYLRDAIPGQPLVIPCEEIESSVPKRDNEDLPTNTSTSADFESDDERCASDQSIENDVLVRFINPQVHFEIEREDGSRNGCIILSALRMQVKFLLVLDSLSAGHAKDRDDSILKFRNIWSFEDSQFLVQDLNTIVPGKYAWLPLESQRDQNIPVDHFGRVIDHAKVVFQTDKPNPLYTQRNATWSSTENPTTFRVRCPVLRCTATSYEYVTFYDFFKNLLVYRDPASGERSERLKKMLFALEYSDDLDHYKITVLTLQEKIRQTEFLLKYSRRGGRLLEPGELVEVRRAWREYRSDLFVLMEALQNLQNIEIKRKSLNIAWQLFVKIDEFTWLLQLNDDSCLCRWTISTLFFGWINNEDQSNTNTLEIDTTRVENLSQSPNMFRDVISPYNPEGRDINYDKLKMIRVYWRKAPPVGGIQVVAHFEVNIQPLLIQFTYDFGKHLSRYMFPSLMERKEIESAPSKREHRDAELEKKEKAALSSSLERSSTTSVSNLERDQIQQMQERANQIKSFIYIKVPGVQHCMSYRGSKEKNFEDLNMFAFYLPTLEYRNKTWSWLDFLNAIKKDAFRAALANTGALVREKFFTKKTIHQDHESSDTKLIEDRLSVVSTSSNGGGKKKGLGIMNQIRKLVKPEAPSPSLPPRNSPSPSLFRRELSQSSAKNSLFAPPLPRRSTSPSGSTSPSTLELDSEDGPTPEITIIEPLPSNGRSTPFPQELLTLSQKAKIFFGKNFPDVVMPTDIDDEDL